MESFYHCEKYFDTPLTDGAGRPHALRNASKPRYKTAFASFRAPLTQVKARFNLSS